MKVLVLWKSINWEWMFSSKNSSNLRHEVCINWQNSTESTGQVLKTKNRLISGSVIYLSVSNPRNQLINVTMHWVSSLKMLASTRNGRFSSWTFVLKQLLNNYCFFSIAESLKYWTIDSSLYSFDFRVNSIGIDRVFITTKELTWQRFLELVISIITLSKRE